MFLTDDTVPDDVESDTDSIFDAAHRDHAS